MKRNLLFYLYPKKWSIWPWHINTLMSHKGVWNGRRILIIAEDSSTEADKKLLPIIAPLRAEIHRVPNDPHLGETRHFLEKLGLLESQDPDEATFYAHSKGVTQSGAWLNGALSWSTAMYALNLGNIAAVERMLTLYGSVGCFRHFLNHAGARWCYAGTFFWLKHSTIFSRKWRSIEQNRFGVEGYPGRHLRWGEMGTFTPDDVGPVWLYNGGVTGGHIEAWKGNWGGTMHGSVMNYLRAVVSRAEVDGKDVIEIGSYNVNGTARDVFAPLKPRQYVGIDQEAGPGVDRVVNASDILKEVGENSFDIVVSTEMLEHAKDWRTAVSNMKAITKPDGLLYVTTRGPGFPYHGFPHDHWRYTVEDFRKIFADMQILDVRADPEYPGVFIKCRKPKNWKAVDLSNIHVVPAPLPPQAAPPAAAPPARAAVPAPQSFHPAAASPAASTVHVAVSQPQQSQQSHGGACVIPPLPQPTGPGRQGPSVNPTRH